MFEKLEIFQMAGAMARHAATRQSLIAQNIAQADTPGYKARDLASFTDTYQEKTAGMNIRTTRAGHLSGFGVGANDYPGRIIAGAGSESPNGNNVSLEGEMMKAAGVRKQHDQAMAIYKASLGILRSSIGRR